MFLLCWIKATKRFFFFFLMCMLCNSSKCGKNSACHRCQKEQPDFISMQKEMSVTGVENDQQPNHSGEFRL